MLVKITLKVLLGGNVSMLKYCWKANQAETWSGTVHKTRLNVGQLWLLWKIIFNKNNGTVSFELCIGNVIDMKVQLIVLLWSF